MKIPRIRLPAPVRRPFSRRLLIFTAIIAIVLVLIPVAWIWILPGAGIIPKDLGFGRESAAVLTTRQAGAGTLLTSALAQPLTADFYAVQVTPDDAETLRFVDLSRGNPDGWYWDFGDGTNSTDPSPVHRFVPPAGSTAVSLTVTRNDGAVNRIAQSGLLSESSGPMTVLLNTNRIGAVLKGSSLSFRVNDSGSSITVNGNPVTLPQGSVVRVRVNRESDGSVAVRNGQILDIAFPDVTLYVDGAQAARGPVGQVTLKNIAWLATDLQFIVRPISGEVRQFVVDGNTLRAGQHNANIRIRNLDLSSYTNLTLETVPAYFSGNAREYQFVPEVIAEFNPATSVSGEVPFNVTFSDRSAGSPVTWQWDFGDGTTSSEQNPGHTYREPGSYTVKLTARNGEIADTKERDQLVVATIPRVEADFSATPVSGPAPLQVQFTDHSSGSPSYWMWDFGDGSSPILSTERSPVHTYSEKGVYSVWFGVGNIFGSSDLYRQQYIIVSDSFRSPENAVLLRAGREGYLEPGSTLRFTVAGSPGRISTGGKEYTLPVGTKVQLVIPSEQHGSIDITNGRLVRFDIGDVTLYINDNYAWAGRIDSIYISRMENVQTSLSYYMPPSTAWTQYAENGYDILADLEDHWIRVSNVGMNENGILSLIATENSTYLDGAAYRTEHDWIIE